MSSHLDRISEEAQIIIEYGIAVTPEDVLALVNVAKAAERVDEASARMPVDMDEVFTECEGLHRALAALGKEQS